jgi:hypothetical protein
MDVTTALRDGPPARRESAVMSLTALSRPDVELVAYAGDVDRVEPAAAVGRQQELEAQYAAGEIDTVELLAEARGLLPPGSAVAVFVERS